MPVVKEGLRLLRGRWYVVPADKEPGCALVSSDDMEKVVCEILSKQAYAETSIDNIHRQVDRRAYFALCKDVCSIDKRPGLLRQLLRTCRDGAAISAQLQVLCKTHKQPVSWRNVHACPTMAYNGLAYWAAEQLEKATAGCSWMVRSTEELVGKLKFFTMNGEVKLIHADIREFYMSGDVMWLSERACRFFPGLPGS